MITPQDIEVQREEAFEKCERQSKIETAKNMLKDNLDIETIVKYTGFSIDTIKNLK